MKGQKTMTIAQPEKSIQKPLWRTMTMFLIPLMLSNVLQSVGQLVATIIVGRWLGVNALAAVAAFFPVLFLLVSLTIGVGTGSSILIGQAYGAKNYERLKTIAGSSLTFISLMGVIAAILGGVFAWDILRVMGTPENVISASVHYARICSGYCR